MDRDLARNWMWSEACEMLARAERLHREFFRPAGLVARIATWEPPVDTLETEREVRVLVALPGVNPERVDAAVDGSDLVVVGTRVLPDQGNHGRFQLYLVPLEQVEVSNASLESIGGDCCTHGWRHCIVDRLSFDNALERERSRNQFCIARRDPFPAY